MEDEARRVGLKINEENAMHILNSLRTERDSQNATSTTITSNALLSLNISEQ